MSDGGSPNTYYCHYSQKKDKTVPSWLIWVIAALIIIIILGKDL